MTISDSAHKASKPLMIGSVQIPNGILLAPMSGITDLPFRQLAMQFGAGLVVSEMVASKAFAVGKEEMRLRAEGQGMNLHAVQLAGNRSDWMAEAAKLCEGAGAGLIDINMGCPAKRVINGYSGSALMKDLDHAVRLIDAVVMAVTVPVTVKMRLGWDDGSKNASELARRAEQSGAQLITVHGRTRCQFYKGSADWRAIAPVKEGLGIPLISNGDLIKVEDAPAMLEQSHSDGVMVGRGAYGRPWLPGHVAHYLKTGEVLTEPEGQELLDLILDHYQHMIDYYPHPVGVRCARKHLGWYMDGIEERFNRVAPEQRRSILTEMDPNRVEELIKAYFSQIVEGMAA